MNGKIERTTMVRYIELYQNTLEILSHLINQEQLIKCVLNITEIALSYNLSTDSIYNKKIAGIQSASTIPGVRDKTCTQ